MKNKYFIIIVGLLINITSLYSSVKVTGVIKSKDNEVVPFANIAIMQNDQLIAGTASNEVGLFELTIDNQDVYTLSISHILYLPKNVELKVDNQDIDLGTIEVSSNNEMLDEINVIAQDVIHKADRDIIILSDKYKKQASNTEQVLKKLPSVSMDIISRSFKVANRKNVLLQVDGIVKDEQYIRSLPPSKMVKVEIIRDVSGRYANDYDAILNVITDKSLRGYSISTEDMSIVTFADENNNCLMNTMKVSYSYFTPKVNIYGGYYNDYNKFNVPNKKIYNYNDDFYVQQITKAEDNLYSSSINNAYLGTDFVLAPGKVLSAELRYSFSPYRNNKQISEQEFSSYDSDILLNQFMQKKSMKAENSNPYVLVSYDGNIGNKNKISAGVSYYNNKNDYTNSISVENVGRNEVGSDKKNYIDLYIEDNLQLNSAISLNINYNYKYQDSRTSYKINNVLAPEYTNSFLRHNGGIYFNYNISENSHLKVGSAIESIQLENKNNVTDISDNQIVVLPFFSYNKKVAEVLDIKFNYKVNTNNPSMSQLSPYTSVIDSFTITSGNPLLKPSYYHELKGTLDVAGGGIVLQPFYKFGKDVQARTGTLLDDHIVQYSYANALKYQKYGFDFMGSIFSDLENKDQVYLSFEVQKFWEKAQFENYKHSITDWEITSQLAYLSHKYDALIAAVFQKNNVKNITALGYGNNTNDFLALAFKKGLFNSKLELGCTYITPYSDLFTTHIGDVESGSGFNRSDIKNVSVIQNTFIFQLVFNLNKNSDKQITKSKKTKLDKDKIRTGLL